MESNVFIEVNVVTKMFRVVDTTDYAALGVNLSGLSAKGLGTVRFDGNIVLQKLLVGDPLINLQTGGTTSAWVACPLDSEGNAAYGTYTLTDYSVRTMLDNAEISAVGVGTGGAGSFTLEGFDMREVFEVGDTFTITDSLSANNGVKTITSMVYASGNTQIFVNETVNAEGVVSSELTYDATKVTGSATAVFAGCTQITPSFTFDADCDYGTFGRLSVVDTTDVQGQTIVSRELTLMYPSWKDEANVTSDEGGIVLNALSTGTWTVQNVYELSQTTGGLIVTYTASIEEERKVSCAGSLCGLLPCIENLWNVHKVAVKSGFSPYQYYVDGILLNYTQAVEYKKCGEFEKYQEKVAVIDELLDASGCECSCCDDDVLIDVVNVGAGDVTILEELQTQIDELDARVDAIAASVVSITEEQVTQNEQIEAVAASMVRNSLIFVNNVRIQGSATWADLVFDVPSDIFSEFGDIDSNACVDIEIHGSTGDSLAEYVLTNVTTGTPIAIFTGGGDRFKLNIRLVYSGAEQVSAVQEKIYENAVDGHLVFGDTPTFNIVGWDFAEDVNQLRLTCDDEDVQFIDLIKVTTHSNI